MLKSEGLINRIIEDATSGDDLGQILETLCNALAEGGLAILQASLAIPTLDPSLLGLNFVWWHGRGVSLEQIPHSADAEAAYRNGLIFYLLDRGELTGRWRLDDPAVALSFPLFHELRERGATELAMRLVGFGQRQMTLEGTALSVSTDSPVGFREGDLAVIRDVVPALALAAYRVGLGRIVTHTLAAYLGERTANRVLTGTIQRGDGEAITAAVLLADLNGFTVLSERESSRSVVGWLNEHFEAMGEPVHAHGGEILKFIGDGILAIFAADPQGRSAAAACADALKSAVDVLTGTQALNRRRADAGEPELTLNVVLHYGDVFYGNIGTPSRLDFTVIGRVVNEASRMEELCKTVNRNLLMSKVFARNCSDEITTTSIGYHNLRDIGVREIFTNKR